MVCHPAHLHVSVRLSVLPTAPLCPMLPNLALFVFCCLPPPSPSSPSFRVIWWNQTLFLGRLRSPLSRSDPSIISPTPISDNPPRETVSSWRRSFSVCLISNNLAPISNRQPFLFCTLLCVLALFSPCPDTPPQMVLENKSRVQALATLFDAATEDAQGRTYSQKRAASGVSHGA